MSLKDEKVKLDYSHQLEIKRIWLDKLLIGVLIVLAGFTANIVLENYKSELIKSQFLLDKRLEALKDIRMIFSRLTQHAHDVMVAKPESVDAQLKAYQDDINNFVHNGNEWGFLFSDNFNQEVNQYMWIHEAVARGKIKLTGNYQGFLDDVSAAFDTATKTALAVEVFGNPQPAHAAYFHVKTWTPDQVHKLGLDKFFLENFSKWKQQRTP
jgi:hypothetical protein